MKVSSWKKYDKGSGLWISSPKPVYGYWFRFLILASKDRPDEVDWSLYEEWGGKDYILRTTQSEWWKKNWKTLFGYKVGEKPLYPLSNAPTGEPTRPQPDGIRFALMVYELRDKSLLDGNDLTDTENEGDGKVGDNWEIAQRIATKEQPERNKRGRKDPSYDPDDWMFHYARKAIVKELRKTNPKEFSKQRRTIQSRVGRYMRAAENHWENVCKGRFP